jgi:arylsulfatase A-like enzyme
MTARVAAFITIISPWLLPCAVPVIADASRPNIVFILADDAGLGDIACYGSKYARTPHIDRLAREGMLFTRAYSASAVCAPTRASFMTGLHTGHGLRRANPSKHGILPFQANTMTVARFLQNGGYATGGFGKWSLGNPGTPGVPEKQGFDVFFGYYDQTRAHDYYPDYLDRNSERVPIDGNLNGGRRVYSHILIADETLKFIEQNKSRPFFCYAAWTLPHGKYEVPSDAPYTQEPWGQKVKNYAAMISLLDKDVGRVVEKIKELGLDDRTLVIFTSDNGANQEFLKPLGSSGGLRGYKRLLYEGGIRTPFIARWPGKIRPGSTSDVLTSHVDFFRTAADLAGLEPPAGLDGVSIAPTLLGGRQIARNEHLYFEIYEPYFQQAVRWGDWKGYRTGTEDPLELYNIASDPGETRNVASEHPDVLKNIRSIMASEHVPSPHWDVPKHREPSANRKKNRTAASAAATSR